MAKYREKKDDIIMVDHDTGKVVKHFEVTNKSSSSNKYTTGSVVSVIIVCLLLVAVLFSLLNKDIPGIGWLLETLQSVPKIDMGWVNDFLSFQLPELYIFDVNLLGWLQPLLSVFRAILFIATAIIQCVLFFVYILGALFF